MTEFAHESWYTATATDASYGTITKGGSEVPCASVVFMITEGPCKDKTTRWDVTKWDTKNNVFTFRKLKICGWEGRHPGTIKNDIVGASKAGKTVRIQMRWVEYGENGFWSVDRIMPDDKVARTVEPATQDADALMLEMMAEADRSDAEYRASRGSGGGSGRNDDYGGYDNTPNKPGNDLPF